MSEPQPDIPRTCAFCEYFDGGGASKVELARTRKVRLDGDCHNSASPWFTISSEDTCPGWAYGPMPGEAGEHDDA